MENASLIILIALLQYLFFTMRVGINRKTYQVLPPKVSGNESWERLFRVQQNTMEQLVIFIPSTFLFAFYVSSSWVLLPGVLFILGRQFYSHLYINNPASRLPGMAITLLANVILVLGSPVGVISKLVGN